MDKSLERKIDYTLGELQTLIDSLREEILNLEIEVEMLENQVAEKDQKIDDLHEELANLKTVY